MILFVGCSYTWGSGLQYEYLHNEKGWSVDEINKVLPNNYHLENLSYEADEYRKQNNWPNLVAKELNKAFVIGTYTNGGSQLNTIKQALEYTHRIARNNSIDTIVVQFTDWLRDVNDEEYVSFDQFQENNNLQLADVIDGFNDEHFNSKGCKVIADSIVRKLEQ